MHLERVRIGRPLLALLLVAVVASADEPENEAGEAGDAAVTVEGATGDPFTPGFAAEAVAELENAETLSRESEEVNAGLLPAPFFGFRYPDYAGELVNVANGQRRSYEPAGLTDDSQEVWFFGGSALFGFGTQPDEGTIPSAYARIAESEGLPLRVRNFGAPAYVNYQEVMQMAGLLASGGRPDLVIFHDGYNDMIFQLGRDLLGDPGAGEHSYILFGSFIEMLARDQGKPIPPTLGLSAGAPIDRNQFLSSTMMRFTEGVELGSRLADAYGFPILFTWQPDIHSKNLVGDEPSALAASGYDDEMAASVRAISSDLRESLPPGVSDYSTVFDAVSTPVMANNVHVNVLGAETIAAQMWKETRDRFER